MKLAHYFTSLRHLMQITADSFRDILNFSALLFIIMVMFALIGKQLFAYKAIIDENGELVLDEQEILDYIAEGKIVRYPRTNFNTFWEALVAVYIVIIGEDWCGEMYTWSRVYDNYSYMRRISLAYFMIMIIFGNLVMMALFTGLLLSNFDKSIHNMFEKEKDS